MKLREQHRLANLRWHAKQRAKKGQVDQKWLREKDKPVP